MGQSLPRARGRLSSPLLDRKTRGDRNFPMFRPIGALSEEEERLTRNIRRIVDPRRLARDASTLIRDICHDDGTKCGNV